MSLIDKLSHAARGGGYHSSIAKEMQHEFLSCPVETFLSHYMPFSPSAENITSARQVLVGSGHFDQWQAFGCTNPSSLTEHEEKVFKPLETIVNTLLDLEVTDPTTHQLRRSNFRHRDCPRMTPKGESMGSATFKVDAYMRPEGVRSDGFLVSDAAIIAEFKKNKDRKSVQSVCSCCEWSWVVIDVEIRMGSSFSVLQAVSWLMIPVACGCMAYVFC